MSELHLPVHAPVAGFEVDPDGVLLIGGRRLTELAEALGTPFYAYDRSLVDRRIEALRAALPAALHLHYAVKANPMPALVEHIVPLVDGFDVASEGELRVTLAAGADPASISFAGPGKRDAELRAAVEAGIVVNVESERELERLVATGEKLGRRPMAAIRINPDFELKTSGMKMSGGPKQFGVDAERTPALLARFRSLQAEFAGFHIFSGSQNLRPQAIVEAQNQALTLAIELARSAPAAPRLLNIGGGFGIPYFPGEQRLDLAPIAENLARLVEHASQALPGTTLVVELGRYIVGEAGIYVCRVIERKESRGEVFLVTDGGLHHHLAASGNFGQAIRRNYPVVIGTRLESAQREIASVVGPLCTPLDVLARRAEMARAEEGDLVVVFQSGAYGYSASPLAFLSHPPPREVLV